MKKSRAFRKNYMKVGVKEVATCRHDASHGEVYIEKTDDSCSIQKEYDFVFGDTRPRSGRRAFHYDYSVLGRRSLDWQTESRAKKAWMRQIREVQTWKQVRGPAGAVICETRDQAHIGLQY